MNTRRMLVAGAFLATVVIAVVAGKLLNGDKPDIRTEWVAIATAVQVKGFGNDGQALSELKKRAYTLSERVTGKVEIETLRFVGEQIGKVQDNREALITSRNSSDEITAKVEREDGERRLIALQAVGEHMLEMMAGQQRAADVNPSKLPEVGRSP